MSTTLYYATTTPSISPAFDAEWDITATAGRGMLVLAKSNTALATTALQKTAVNVLNQDRLIRQFVSRPMRAQTITGTVKGQMMALESSTGLNGRSQMVIRACSFDGASFTGTLYAGDLATLDGSPPSEWPTAIANRQMPRGGAVALTELAINDGDRLVVEVGYRVHTTTASNFSGSLRWGDNGTVDLPEDETDTDQAKLPWLQFSQTLTWAPSVIDNKTGLGYPLGSGLRQRTLG